MPSACLSVCPSVTLVDHDQGRIQDLGLEGAKSSAESISEWVWGGGVPLPIGVGVWEGAQPPPQRLFSFLGLRMRILECLFLQRNTSRSSQTYLHYACPL